jgi:hypothetical protein
VFTDQLRKDLSVRIAMLTSKQTLDTGKKNAGRGELQDRWPSGLFA